MKISNDSIDLNSTSARFEVAPASRLRGYRFFAPLYDLVFGLGLQHARRLAIAVLDIRPGDRMLGVGVGSGLLLPWYPKSV